MTTRGLVEEDMEEIAQLIHLAVEDFQGNGETIRQRVQALCQKYPLYE